MLHNDQKSLPGTISRLATKFDMAMAGLVLRLGLAVVFLTGGSWKLARLLDQNASGAMVEQYLSTKGYINGFFNAYLFEGPFGDLITPWSFLTALSIFEFLSGLALLVGLLVRPLALIYGFLLWTFVIALPVVTISAHGSEPSHFSPALLVQIRDISLSGMMFVLFALGSGRLSLDSRLFGSSRQVYETANWQNLGLLLRLSVAVTFLVGGLFAGFDSISSFNMPPVLLVLGGLSLAFAAGLRVGALALFAMVLVYVAGKVSFDASLLDNLNAVKREFALAGGLVVLTLLGGGSRFDWRDLPSLARPPKLGAS